VLEVIRRQFVDLRRGLSDERERGHAGS
jgi:hypothetical protein